MEKQLEAPPGASMLFINTPFFTSPTFSSPFNACHFERFRSSRCFPTVPASIYLSSGG